MNNKRWITFLVAFLLSTMAATSTAIASTGSEWAGLYAGGFVGGSSGSRITSIEPLRLDNNAFWFRPYHNSFSYKTKSSFIGGLTIGYNLQICSTPFLVGLEGEYGYLNLRGSHIDPNQLQYAALSNNQLQNSSQNILNIGKSSGYATLGTRIIYAIDPALFYLKSGALFTRVKSKYDSVKTEDQRPVHLNLSGANDLVGYSIGGGIEYTLPFEYFSNVSTKIEYLFLGIHKRKNVYGHCSCNFSWRIIEHIRGINTVKIGINYNFM